MNAKLEQKKEQEKQITTLNNNIKNNLKWIEINEKTIEKRIAGLVLSREIIRSLDAILNSYQSIMLYGTFRRRKKYKIAYDILKEQINSFRFDYLYDVDVIEKLKVDNINLNEKIDMWENEKREIREEE